MRPLRTSSPTPTVLDDMHPYLYKTTDFGATWTRLDGKLASDLSAFGSCRPGEAGTAVLGTERGVMFSSTTARRGGI
jgi:photosystem II stability/assembly factor-like uncharacterized protein